MFDNVNYVPILRSKQAEFDALKQMRTADRGLITPLIDILPATLSGDITQGLTKLASKICSSWNARPIFVDLGSVDLWNMGGLLHAHPVTLLWDSVIRSTPLLFPSLRPTLIPVTGLLRHENYEAAVRTVMNPAQDGVCLRLTREDVQRESLPFEIGTFLARMGLVPADVHLLVDYKLISEDSLPNIAELCIRLPYLNEWRNFTIAAGSFPKDVSSNGMKADGEHILPRLEWRLWRDQVVAVNNLPRHPSFGDYGTYHPIYIEPPRNITPSAHIRYASVDHWVVMRGRQAVAKNGGCQQYPKLALALRERVEYCGAPYSAGDLRIDQMAEAYHATSGNVKNPGGTTKWLEVGFNHHLTLTARNAAVLRAVMPIEEPALAA